MSEQLATYLAPRGKATLLARDGDVTRDIADQLRALPATATHLVVSVGGNDALGHRSLLQRGVQNAAEVFAELAAIHAAFLVEYGRMLDAVLACGKPTTVCTIYDSNFDAPQKQLADVALSVFNDVILRCAGRHGVPVLDLRRVFQSPWTTPTRSSRRRWVASSSCKHSARCSIATPSRRARRSCTPDAVAPRAVCLPPAAVVRTVGGLRAWATRRRAVLPRPLRVRLPLLHPTRSRSPRPASAARRTSSCCRGDRRP